MTAVYSGWDDINVKSWTESYEQVLEAGHWKKQNKQKWNDSTSQLLKSIHQNK